MKLKDLIEQYGDYEVIDTVDTGIHKGNSKNNGINIYLKKPKPKTIWDLEKGDHYIYVDGMGNPGNHNYLFDSTLPCAREVGNAFLTQEEAEQDIERRKVETLLLKHGGRRWFKKGGSNWMLCLDVNNLASRYLADEPLQGAIYFDSHEKAVKACEEIGNKRTVKALFEVR